MAHAQPARITCRVCDGWYVSESDLREHMQAAHRRFIPATITAPISAPIAKKAGDPQYAGPQPQNVKTEPRRLSLKQGEEWTDEEESAVSMQHGRAGR
jgi:hypothetical protein